MIYFDNASTVPMLESVKQEIVTGFSIQGNPSSQYTAGREAKTMISKCRSKIETRLNIESNSFIFTSGGSESDYVAIKAAFLYGLSRNRRKIIVSSIEHHAILNTCLELKKLGAQIEYIKVDHFGFPDLNDLKSKLDYNTAIVSIMTSNNEIGTIIDIYKIAEMAHKYGALFHTDAVQGITHQRILRNNGIDMYSISAHKFGGPKGIGGLYINPNLADDFRNQKIMLIPGGNQELFLRGGTENVPYIMGMVKAIEVLNDNFKNIIEKEQAIQDYAYNKIKKSFPSVSLNGPSEFRYRNPSNLNFAFHYADASSIVEWCNMYGVNISSGSACNTGSRDPSHVLKAIGLSDQDARSSIRLSFSDKNTTDEVDNFIEVLKIFEHRFKI